MRGGRPLLAWVAMRRPTFVVLVVLFAVIITTAIVQLTMDAPDAPFAGPSSPGALPVPSPSPTT
jgi:hypothetical protein